MDLGRSLTLDPGSGAIIGDQEAVEALARAYRSPWEHPAAEKV
jgi:hypothetical protein